MYPWRPPAASIWAGSGLGAQSSSGTGNRRRLLHRVHCQTRQNLWIKIRRFLGHDIAFESNIAYLIESCGVEEKGDLRSSFPHGFNRRIAIADVGDVTLFLHSVFSDTEALLDNEPVQDDHIQRSLFLG